VGFRASRVGGEFARDFARHHVVMVPELSDAGLVKACQHSSGRLLPIRWQNRFPNYQYMKVGVMDSFKQGFGCRGPLQAHRSGG
jgi:hypothetical protein